MMDAIFGEGWSRIVCKAAGKTTVYILICKSCKVNPLPLITIDFGMCNIFAVLNSYDCNRCNHDFSVPLKTCDGQIES